MAQPKKYYYITAEFGKLRNTLYKWSESVVIDVFENYEWVQYIVIDLLKDKEKQDKPKTQSYQKVKPILKELFEDYYDGALRHIAKRNIDDWEYYILPESENWTKVEAYSMNESNEKGCIKFNLIYNIDNLNFTVYSSSEIKSRPQARKNGTPITYEQFRRFNNMALQYLSDHDSLLVYHKQFVKNYKNLTVGKGKKVELFNVSSEKAFKDIITQLEKRKASIEKRLIENDQDSKEERLKLRGELEGIIYALKTIAIFK